MPQILITIDTEIGELGRCRPGAFEIFVEGKVNNKEVGYKFIMDLLEKYNIKGEFFVDVYPYKQTGEDKFANLCKNIVKRGHNIQLHTHPSTSFDKKRIYMYQYSLREQIEILELGKQKIKEWTGKYPTAHRAGGYGINRNTIKALEEVGIYYDSSYFYGNENCKFQYHIKNKIFKVGNVIEIPITVFKKIVNYKFLNIRICSREYFQKLDTRYGAEIEEIKRVIHQSNENDILVLFLHSFSFLNLPYNFRKRKYGKIGINEKRVKEFEGLLNWISLHEKCNFTTIDELRAEVFQKDNCIKILSKKNVGQVLLGNFANKILKIRNT